MKSASFRNFLVIPSYSFISVSDALSSVYKQVLFTETSELC